jgi:chromosome segregation ATPase
MDPLLETLLWLAVLLPLTLLVAGMALYLLVRRWEEKTKEDLKEARSRLRVLQAESAGLKKEGEAYTPDDPPPFGTLASEMRAKIISADEHTGQLFKEYAYVQESVRQLDLAQIWQRKDLVGILRYPYDWYSLRQYSSSMMKDIDEPRRQLENGRAYLTRMQSQGWEVARLARQVMEDAQNALRVLSGLRGNNVRDPILESALQEAQDCEQSVQAQVPVYFLSGDEKSVAEQADKETITAVYRLIDRARGSIDDILKNALSWERRFKSLEQALEELGARFRPAAETISSLESAAIHPINWDVSRSRLAALRQSIESLTRSPQTRKIEQVEKDHDTANRLLKELGELTEHVNKLAAAHRDMIEIVELQDIRQGEEWSRQAKRISDQVAAYNSENWPRTAGAGRLAEDLKMLIEQHARLDIKNTSVPVAESELEIALGETVQLKRLHEELRPRLAGVQERLGEIQETERNTRDLLSRTRALLNQALPLISSNTPLAGEAAAEAESLRVRVEELTDEIERRGEGQVDKKAQAAAALVRTLEQSGNQWLASLEESLEERKAVLAEKAGVLRQIAFLDEPAVLEAEQLLGGRVKVEPEVAKRGSLLSGLPFMTGSGARSRTTREQLPFAEVVKELKQKNDEWQRTIAVTRALEDMEGSVLEEHDRLEQNAENARTALSEARQIIPEERNWPPSTQFVLNEQRMLESLEKRRDALKSERLRAIQLVSRLSELSSGFKDLEGKILQIADRAGQEQDRIVELEHRLGESLRLWEYQMQSYGTNLYLKDEIQLLLQETENEFESIRQRYLRGSLPYNQVLQNLRALCQHVESAQATLDSDQVIDINGVVQRRGY